MFITTLLKKGLEVLSYIFDYPSKKALDIVKIRLEKNGYTKQETRIFCYLLSTGSGDLFQIICGAKIYNEQEGIQALTSLLQKNILEPYYHEDILRKSDISPKTPFRIIAGEGPLRAIRYRLSTGRPKIAQNYESLFKRLETLVTASAF